MKWPLAIYFALLGLLVAGAWLQALAPSACDIKLLELASEQMKGVVFSCGEFWLNRYQGLIGNLITAIVAVSTLYWVAGQLRTANRQAAASAAQTLRLRAADIEQEAEWAKAVAAEFIDQIQAGSDEAVASRWRREISLAVMKFENELISVTKDLHKRRLNSAAAPLLANCADGMADLTRCFEAALPLSAEFGAQHNLSGTYYVDEDVREEADREAQQLAPQLDIAESALHDSVVAMAGAWSRYRQALYDRNELVWQQIRRLEEHAIGDDG